MRQTAWVRVISCECQLVDITNHAAKSPTPQQPQTTAHPLCAWLLDFFHDGVGGCSLLGVRAPARLGSGSNLAMHGTLRGMMR